MRRKGERTTAMNERDFPHVVRLPVPENGFGYLLADMQTWHGERGLEERRGRSRRVEDAWFEAWCFADRKDAIAFLEAFGWRAQKRADR